ncbi:MAG TPA: GNAT family N-acetyltransferase [Bacteroidota bacterium]|nr:GNAT family N-acetyltransferase [Bacteroidota bacterium]
MPLKIRRATAADAKAIAGFNSALALETEHLELEHKRLLRGVLSLLNDPSKGYYILAEVDGAIAGQLMITFEWSDWRAATFWWVQSVYVAPEFRSAGVFTRLFQYIENAARKKKSVCGIRLYVEHNNNRAMQAYERLGMKKANYGLYEIDFVIKRS